MNPSSPCGLDAPFQPGRDADSALGFDLREDAWLDLLRGYHSGPGPGRIGPYELLEEIGRGGQGVVYKARQPRTGRLIAIKRVSAGVFATPRMRSRFEREIEAASSLDHPGIVTVYGSEVVDQQPVLAMQWIDGLPIDRWAAGAAGIRKPVHEILSVFVAVCEAVQHAHQRGVIHRDLKPSNILVDAEDRPHVLDFGLARLEASALVAGESGSLSMTHSGEFLGTLAYAAPEQTYADPRLIDVRTDVYALGAVLHELLTGLPLRPAGEEISRCLEIIRHGTPPRPSSLNPSVSREADAIVLKALEKDKDRRYASVEDFRRDVERFLAGEAVLAHPPSRIYAARKYVRRHRKTVAAAVALLTVLLAGATTSTVLYFRSERSRVSETRQRGRAERVGVFLGEMLTLADPAHARGESVTVRQMLDEALRRLDAGELAGEPEVEADIRATIGATYIGLGLYPQAHVQLQRAETLQIAELGEDDPATLRTQSRLAECLLWESDQAGSVALARKTLERQRRVLGEEHPDTLRTMHWLGNGLTFLGPFEEAEQTLRRTVDLRRRVLGENHPETADAMDSLGMAYTWNARPAEAERLHREALDIHVRSLGMDHPTTLYSMNFLGSALSGQGKFDDAERQFREGGEIAQRILGPHHLVTLSFLANRAAALRLQGKHADAEPLLREVFDTSRLVLGESHSNTLGMAAALGEALTAMNRFDEAESVLRPALETARRTYGPAHHDTSQTLLDALAKLGEARRDDAAAAALYRELFDIRRQALGLEHPHTRETGDRLMQILRRQGNAAAAEGLELELSSASAAREASLAVAPQAPGSDEHP